MSAIDDVVEDVARALAAHDDEQARRFPDCSPGTWEQHPEEIREYARVAVEASGLPQALQQRDERIGELQDALLKIRMHVRDGSTASAGTTGDPPIALRDIDDLARSTLQQNTPKESK